MSAPDPIGDQVSKWTQTYAARPAFFGSDASEPALDALRRFAQARAVDVLELGAGQGRDTIAFASAGINVTASDYAPEGLARIAELAVNLGLTDLVETLQVDVREPLPFANDAFDACYSHMLLSMALRTSDIERLVSEVHRVLRPGGLMVYTVRNTTDAHFGAGASHGDDMFEMAGFIVHFFDRVLIERLAARFDLLEVADYEEGRLPRRLHGVTMRKVG